MRNDSLKQYITLREGLTREKQELERRLAMINEALGEGSTSSPGAPESTEKTARGGSSTTAGTRGGARRGRRGKGGLSLRDAVLQATSGGPLSKKDILEAVKKLGYTFTTKDPYNSMGVILYGKNPRFRNDNGLFSPIGGGAGSGGNTGSAKAEKGAKPASSGRKGGRRQMSPEAKARIAEAQRARWARKRAGK